MPSDPRVIPDADTQARERDEQTIREALTDMLDAASGEHWDGPLMHEGSLNGLAALDRLAARVGELQQALERVGCSDPHFCGASVTALPRIDDEGNETEWPICFVHAALAGSSAPEETQP